jgi:hypothetical protein
MFPWTKALTYTQHKHLGLEDGADHEFGRLLHSKRYVVSELNTELEQA